MKSTLFRLTVVMALAAAILPLAAAHAENLPVSVQVQTSRIAAVAGTRLQVALAVTLTVADGTPLPALGKTLVGRPGEVIDLPDGWDLYDPQFQPGGCPWLPTAFQNLDKGRYLIHLIPDPDVPNCTWQRGTYLKSLQIDVWSGNDRLQGSALAALDIP